MPGEDEIRRYEQEHPVSPAMRELLAGIPKIKFDPTAARRKLVEQFQQEYMQTPPEPDKDYPYQKDTAHDTDPCEPHHHGRRPYGLSRDLGRLAEPRPVDRHAGRRADEDRP